MEEQWKDIYYGLYAVSNLGQIKAKDRIVQTKTGPRYYKEKILIPEIIADGHCRVTLVNAGEKQRYLIHRLVAESFLPNPNNYPIVNHKDENPSNNNVDNLEWCSVAYNNAYNNRHQRIGDAEGHDVDLIDNNGNIIKTYPSITKAANDYGFPITTLYRYLNSQIKVSVGNNFYLKKRL